MKKICVIGSINTDLVALVERFPKPGETLTGKEFHTFPGGKGANQAVAAGRLQAAVAMFGKIGADLYGQQTLANLAANGVDHRGVAVVPGVSSGIAVIEVDGSGENHIVIIPGANAAMDRRVIDERFAWLLEYDIFLFQLEIPLDTVCYTMAKLKECGKTIILDPAPAQILPDAVYPCVDFLTPNETEMAILAQQEIDSEDDLNAAAQRLLAKGVGTVLLKAGKDGAYIIDRSGRWHMPGFAVQAVDTTGAGDSFNAGFAVSLAHGGDLRDHVRFANAVGALATTSQGAQSAMPGLEEVRSLLERG
ncbi:ribokinase [Hydrogenispora ethanolica]|jgi:ribokinase|uniref:Ribokinase n=1 Tax=Hydrogenispora ethanolica TaxID=1082276 RepID=A0A4R1RJB9_HYDET|nr:ribokinase [Hydrogenispora ethanolica]TCL65890.1 ribokinase [Hydrogenispora ethanolica]